MKTNFILFLLLLLLSFSCTENKFPVDKKYWDVNDYENVIRELKYGTSSDEKLPTLNDPDTKNVFEKLVDQQNFKVVLEDEELGLKHKNEVAQSFFNVWKDMNSIYTQTDRKDKYIYEKERLEIFHFGLGLQLRYFKLGNEQIVENSDDPNSQQVKNAINSNINTLTHNYIIYLDEINNEKSYSSIGLDLIAEGIDKYFTELINLYPNHDYYSLLNKIELMSNKSDSENIKKSLMKIKNLIETKKKTDLKK